MINFLKSLWYYEEKIYVLDAEVSIVKVPEMNTTRTEIVYPTRQITTFGHTVNGYRYPTPRTHIRTETFSEVKWINERTKGFDIYCLTVSYYKDQTIHSNENDTNNETTNNNETEGTIEPQKMHLFFRDESKANTAKAKLHMLGNLNVGVWMGGYYIKELDYYSYFDNHFATAGAISVLCLAAIGLTGLCFYYIYGKEE
jgi:hypothetical protein